MAKVTRIAYSKNLNSGKLEQLGEIAFCLGNLRQEDDLEIRLWTPYEKVKSILLKRTEQLKADGTAHPRL